MKRLSPIALAMAVATLSACASIPDAGIKTAEVQNPEASIYDPSIDASAVVDAALIQAGEEAKLVLLALGGNWCHDSRAFAGWMQSERFAPLLAENFVLTFVNVGLPQTGDGHNLHIAKRFGIEDLQGTPTVLVIGPDGTVLNADTAADWRNSASRTPDAIHAELASFLPGETR